MRLTKFTPEEVSHGLASTDPILRRFAEYYVNLRDSRRKLNANPERVKARAMYEAKRRQLPAVKAFHAAYTKARNERIKADLAELARLRAAAKETP